MKKVLALMMAMVMLFSLAACGNNAATAGTQEPAARQMTPEEKQALYETFFTAENFKAAGNSAKVSNEYVDISVMQDHDDNKMVEIRVLENYLRVYQLKDGKQYVNLKMTAEDGTSEEGWTEFKGENAIESTEMDLSAINIDLDSITKVEYVETKDGVDTVKLYKANPDYNPDVKITEICLAFEYDNQACEMILTKEVASDGESTTYDTDNVAEGFEVFNYTIDYENNVMIGIEDENEKIPFEVTSQKDVAMDQEVSFEAYVDETTGVMTSMQQLSDGELVLVEFFDVASCLEGVEIPETMDQCDEEDLAMALLAVIFSAMDFEIE